MFIIIRKSKKWGVEMYLTNAKLWSLDHRDARKFADRDSAQEYATHPDAKIEEARQ